MHLLTLFSVFLFYVKLTVCIIEQCQESNGPCHCKFASGVTVELSSFGQPGKPLFSISYDDGILLFHPCYPFSLDTHIFQVEAEHYPCSNTAACELNPGNMTGSSPTQKSLGLQPKFFREDNVVKVNYSPELTVILTCNSSIAHQLERNPNETLNLITYCACETNNATCTSSYPVPHSKTGLSTGSILLITFFVILLVYLGVGIIFNFCRGAHGTELLTNIEFWNELPKLIMDGFLFTCSCFGRRSSYADV